jgi:hypothetical protein
MTRQQRATQHRTVRTTGVVVACELALSLVVAIAVTLAVSVRTISPLLVRSPVPLQSALPSQNAAVHWTVVGPPSLQWITRPATLVKV